MDVEGKRSELREILHNASVAAEAAREEWVLAIRQANRLCEIWESKKARTKAAREDYLDS